MTRHYRLERAQFVPLPRERVFAFFADAFNLEALTPGFLRFKILSPRPIEMRSGTLIDYRLRLFGIPFDWRTRIETFEPPRFFTDTQVRGPYRRWHHRHEFHETSGGTLMVDAVDYEMPWGPWGVLAHRLFVARSLDQIFNFRRDELTKRLSIDLDR